MSKIEARVALVTGGTRGIGESISRGLARDGAKVVAVCNSHRDHAMEFAEKVKAEEGYDIDIRQGNVGNPADCQRIVDEIAADYGRLDYLVNNAGIVRDRTAVKMQLLDFDQVMKVNLYGPFFMAKAALPHFFDAGFGRIVNISSFVGETGRVGQANYAASKSGLFGLTKTLALETAGKGITVNCVIPGAIETEMSGSLPPEILQAVIDMVPMKAMGTGDDIAAAVRFFCSDEAKYVTGALLPVAGGLLMM
ncbi:MAG: 3-oxoacyl-ACP reductase FabG [Austwickia sp.]|jgi:acetoacetyl-CoA reductase|nr:3-oxoacyl-ACP reductase FabG [Austwickia sp.]MBK8435150.1 3-oxoacyl-ACP reductase FabG [Austwickia sp.]MBK9101296.1 3-oxoacyl-ACP reductase FabG [Austwickia sp.]